MKPTAEMIAMLEQLSERELVELCQNIARKTTALSQELTAYLGRPVNIRLISNGLGYTMIGEERPSVTININPQPILEGYPNGPSVFRGFGWHEVGHHKFHSPEARDKAIKEGEGIRRTQKSLQDEHLERRIRSEREDIGQYFDRIIKYDRSGFKPSRHPLQEFHRCLRTHKPSQNPEIAKALALVPKKLKDLSNWELLDLSREVWKILEEAEKQSSQDQDQEEQDQQQESGQTEAEGKQSSEDQSQQQQDQGQQDKGEGAEGEPEESQAGESNGEPEQSYGQVIDIDELPEELRNALLQALGQALEKAAKEVVEAHRRREQQEEDEERIAGGQGLNLDPELDFDLIRQVIGVKKDIPEHQRILSRVRGDVRLLRKFFENLGFTYVDVYDQTDGYDLVPDIDRLAVFGDEDVFIDETLVSKASYDIQVIIDCSGSMGMGDDKMERAKTFGVLTAEALKGIRGITCHFWGFTDTTIFDCGNASSCGASSLEAGGGNNDAAALWHASQKSAVSGKEIKILLMVSDGIPNECSWESLRGLVSKLTKQGFVCVQVAVDRIIDSAFDHFVDLTGHDFKTAVRQFGKLVQKLVVQTGERAGIL